MLKSAVRRRFEAAVTAWLGALILSVLMTVPQIGGQTAFASGLASVVLGPGDRLQITVFGEEGLSGEFRVRPSGKLALPLIGEVEVTGLSPADAEDKITALLKKDFLIDPRVSLEILEYRQIYVLGDVVRPGSHPYKTGMTVLTALAMAGGYTITAEDGLQLNSRLTRARNQYRLLVDDLNGVLARKARLTAERIQSEEIEFPQVLLAKAEDPEIGDLLRSEKRLFAARRDGLVNEANIIRQRIAQANQQILAMEAQAVAEKEELRLINEEIRDVEKLFKRGFERKPRLNGLERVKVNITSRRLSRVAEIESVKQGIYGMELSILDLRNQKLNEVSAQLQAVEAREVELKWQLNTAEQELREAEARAAHVFAGLRAQRAPHFVITRLTADGMKTFAAEQMTVVQPGDIVRIPITEEADPLRKDARDKMPPVNGTDHLPAPPVNGAAHN